MRDPALAGILSLLIPGLGQIYNGRVVIGIIWMIVFGVSWIGSVGIFGWITFTSFPPGALTLMRKIIRRARERPANFSYLNLPGSEVTCMERGHSLSA